MGFKKISRTKKLRQFHYQGGIKLRQNGAPSGLEKRGLDASIYHKTRKPTEGTKVKRKVCRNGCPQRNDQFCLFNEQIERCSERRTDKA
ncbi:hypothetical protein C4X99_14490 [Leptospira interrogans serovar Geyaweera]|nr:hypothetical protein C5473_07995 [Leptospira interrogans serovar Weerasinghe]KAA1291407.1 hypothetical protein C4X99_14490 [Leptospira interrogans serovar Geyaweera]QCO38247.1 hypothetical protein E4412_14490 [Leptospira interrogans]